MIAGNPLRAIFDVMLVIGGDIRYPTALTKLPEEPGLDFTTV